MREKWRTERLREEEGGGRRQRANGRNKEEGDGKRKEESKREGK